MDVITTFLVNVPSGFWESIISAFQSWVVNIALAIILVTICIKIILSPLDFLNRKTTRDNAHMQAKIAPQMAKLQKQYANDPQTLNQKRMELYKSNGFSMGGGCAVMLVYMILSIVIFCTLFSSVLTSAPYRTEQLYLDLRDAYITTYEQTNGTDEVKKQEAEKAVLVEYDNRDCKFLWVQNVWYADNPWTSAVKDYKEYLSTVGSTVRVENGGENYNLTELKESDPTEYERVTTQLETEYNKVMTVVINERGGANGYFITAILAIGASFLSQYIMQRKTKAQQGGVQAPGGGKAMLIIMPLIMGIFTLFYNAVFGMYIIAMQLVSLVTMPLFDKILDKMYLKKELKEQEKIKVDYSRK